MRFTVRLDSASTAPSIVTLSFSGSATGTNGYFGTQPNQSVRFEPNETSHDVTVNASGAVLASSDSAQTLTGSVAPAGAAPSASVTVDPPPKPDLRWGTGYTVNEGDSVMLTATISSALPNDIVLIPLPVPVSHTGYADLADFTVCASFSLLAGQTTSEPCQLTATLNDDDGDSDTYDPGNSERLVMGFESITGVTTHYCSNCIDIVDVPPPPSQVSLRDTSRTIPETDGSGVAIVAVLDSPTPAAASVAVTASGAARGYGSCYAGVEFYLSPASFNFAVGDDESTITLYPCADVTFDDETVTVSSSNTVAATAAPNPMTFTPLNWNNPQTVTITAGSDTIDNGGTFGTTTISHSLSGGGYSGVTASSVAVTVNDDDVTPPTFSGTGTCQVEPPAWIGTWTNGPPTPTVEVQRRNGTALVTLNDGDSNVAGQRGETFSLAGRTLTVSLPAWHWYNDPATDPNNAYHASAPKSVVVGTTEIISDLSGLIKINCQIWTPG